MREIKFSYILQHEETGRFLEKVFTYLDIFSGEAKKFLEENPRFFVVAKRQYTGLKDKNGKEIWEDDIIFLYESDKKGVRVMWDEDIAGFGFKGQDMATHLNFRKLSSRNYIVIGNLYENPELLNKTI